MDWVVGIAVLYGLYWLAHKMIDVFLYPPEVRAEEARREAEWEATRKSYEAMQELQFRNRMEEAKRQARP
jgi:hypothetical protein